MLVRRILMSMNRPLWAPVLLPKVQGKGTDTDKAGTRYDKGGLGCQWMRTGEQ